MSLDLKVHLTQILFNPFREKCLYGSFQEAGIVSNGMKKNPWHIWLKDLLQVECILNKTLFNFTQLLHLQLFCSDKWLF